MNRRCCKSSIQNSTSTHSCESKALLRDFYYSQNGPLCCHSPDRRTLQSLAHISDAAAQLKGGVVTKINTPQSTQAYARFLEARKAASFAAKRARASGKSRSGSSAARTGNWADRLQESRNGLEERNRGTLVRRKQWFRQRTVSSNERQQLQQFLKPGDTAQQQRSWRQENAS